MQIQNDENSNLTVSNKEIALTTSLDIILKDIFVNETIYVLPISITTTASIEIRNITIGTLNQGTFIFMNTKLKAWLSLFSPTITVEDINVFTPLNYHQELSASLFYLMNFQNAKILNYYVLGYPESLLQAISGKNLKIENFYCESINVMENLGLLQFSKVGDIIFANSTFSEILLNSQTLIAFDQCDSISFYQTTIKQNIINCDSHSSCSLISVIKANRLIFNRLYASFNYAFVGFVLLQAKQIYTFSIESSYLANNTYPESQKGGLIQVSCKDSSSQFLLLGSIIERSGSSDYVEDIFVNVPNLVGHFKAIQLDMPSIILISSKFLYNLGGVFDLMNAYSTTLQDCLFEQNQSIYASSLNINSNQNSILQITSSNFTSNSAICSLEGKGGAINVNYLTNLKIKDSYFRNNTADPGLYGGVLNFQEIQNMQILNSIFSWNTATLSGGVIFGRVISNKMEIEDSEFTFNKASQNGGVIYIKQIEDMSIKNTKITSNTAMQNGGFLYAIKVVKSIFLLSSQFYENAALFSSGGVLFISNSITFLTIENTQIIGNQAKVGGFLGINIIQTLSLNGLFSDINKTVISSNIAELGGALFQFLIFQIKIDGVLVSINNQTLTLNNLLSNNFGIQQGDAFFSSPIFVQLVGAQEYQDNIGNQCELPLVVTEINTQKEDIPFYVIDSVNSNSVVRLQFKLFSDYTDSSTKKHIDNKQYNQQKCSQYFASITIDDDNIDDDSFESFQEVAPYCNEEDDSIFDLSYKLSFIPTTEINSTITFFSQIATSKSIKIQWNFRSCYSGEIFIEQGGLPICYPCPYHTYSFENPYDPTAGKSCIPIPTIGVEECYRNIMSLSQGFWRESLNSSEIIECTNLKHSCLGGTLVNNQLCEVGHIGPLCEQCDLQGTFWGQPYSSMNGFNCQQCQTLESNILWIIFAGFVTIIFSSIVCRSSYKNTLNSILGHYMRSMGVCRLGNSIFKQNLFSVYIKIFLSYLQLSQVLYTFQVRPLGIFTAFSNSASQPVSTTLMQLDCFFKDFSQSSIVFLKVRLVAILPVGVVLIILFLIYSLYFSGILSSQERRHSLISSILYCIVSLLQFNIVLFLLQSRACREIGSNSFAYLDLTLNCDDSTLSDYRIFIIYPLLIFWTLAVPLGLFYFLYKRRDKLFSNIQLQFQVRFLYGEYKQSFYYWELIRLFLRILVAYFFTEFYSQGGISGLSILFILIIYETAVIYFSPFQSRFINFLEGESIFIVMVNIFLAMIYKNLLLNQTNPNEQMSYEYTNFWQQPNFVTGLLIAIIQILNFYFIIKYIYITFYALFEHHRVIRQIEDKIRRRFPLISQLICKTRTNSIQVSMRWNLVRKLIKSGKIFTLPSKRKQINIQKALQKSIFFNDKVKEGSNTKISRRILLDDEEVPFQQNQLEQTQQPSSQNDRFSHNNNKKSASSW